MRVQSVLSARSPSSLPEELLQSWGSNTAVCGYGLHLQYGHQVWVPVHIMAVSLLSQLPVSGLGRQQRLA